MEFQVNETQKQIAIFLLMTTPTGKLWFRLQGSTMNTDTRPA